jgi:hypothetical protein
MNNTWVQALPLVEKRGHPYSDPGTFGAHLGGRQALR